MYFEYGDKAADYLKTGDRKLFEKSHCRLSPCGSAASLSIRAAAGGALPDMRDPAPEKRP